MQRKRRDLEEYIKNAKLDLDLHTDRNGSPHTLVCRKNDKSHHRACKQRTADEELLAVLRSVDTAG